MTIRETCPSCSSPLNAPDSAAGKMLKCPKCGAMIAVASDVPPVIELVPLDLATATPARKRSRRKRKSGLLSLGNCIMAIVTLAAGIALYVRFGDHVTSHAHADINQWLRDNTHSGEWEEVAFAGPVAAQDTKGRRGSVCVIRIRTANAFGALNMQKMIFARYDDEPHYEPATLNPKYPHELKHYHLARNAISGNADTPGTALLQDILD